MKEITKTVWVTDRCNEFFSLAEAQADDERLDMYEALNGLDIYWRDTGPEELANDLLAAGYKLVQR